MTGLTDAGLVVSLLTADALKLELHQRVRKRPLRLRQI